MTQYFSVVVEWILLLLKFPLFVPGSLLEQITAERLADQPSVFPLVLLNCFCELPDAVPGPVLDPGVLGLLRKLRWGSHSVCEGREF